MNTQTAHNSQNLQGTFWYSQSYPTCYRYGYQGSEKDDEVKGKGNHYTTEFRQLDVRLGRWFSVDPLEAQFPWQSAYMSMDGNPVNLTDPMGLASEGDYYDKDGNYLGSDGKVDDIAYVAESVTKDKDGKVVSAVKKEKLKVKHSVLKDLASSVADESSGDKKESYAIASTVLNGSKKESITITKFLEKYTSGYKSKESYDEIQKDKNKGDNYKHAMGAAINAVRGGVDYSNGAERWDGRDLITQGSSHYRYKKAYYDSRKGIFIPSDKQEEVHEYIQNVARYYEGLYFTEKIKSFGRSWVARALENVWTTQVTSVSNQAGSLYTVVGARGQTIFFVHTSVGAASQATTYQSYQMSELDLGIEKVVQSVEAAKEYKK